MNIRVGPVGATEMPLKHLEDPVIVRQTQEAAIAAILDGYSVLVYNFIRDGSTPLNALDTCTFHGFDDLERVFNEQTEQRNLANLPTKAMGVVRPNFSKIRQMTRLTLVFSQGTYIHQTVNLGNKAADKATKIMDSYDIVAVRPMEQECLYKQAFE